MDRMSETEAKTVVFAAQMAGCPSDKIAFILKPLYEYIESSEAEIKSLRTQLRNARNELCYKCGRYHEAHNGACDGCKWK